MNQAIRALFIAALCFGLNPVAWAKIPFINEDPEGTFRPYVYEFEVQLAKPYRVLVIEHDSFYGINVRSREGQAIMDLIHRSRKVRRDSFRETMKQVYPDKTPAEIEAILDKIDENDRSRSLHSSRIIVLEGGAPIDEAKIIAGLRLVMDGDSGSGLEMQEALPGYSYPRKWEMQIKFGREHRLLNQDQPDEPARAELVEPAHWLAHFPQLIGGTIQLTNFFNNGSDESAREIGAVLNFVASQISLRRPESMPFVRLNDSMKEEYSRLVNHLIPAPDVMQLVPTEVAAYADRRLAVNYYMRVMKFKNVNPSGEAVQGQDYVVRQDLTQFDEISRNSFVYRDGRNRLHKAGIRRIWLPGQEYAGGLHYTIKNDQAAALDYRWDPSPRGTWTLPAPLVRSYSFPAPALEPLICAAFISGWSYGPHWYLSQPVDMTRM